MTKQFHDKLVCPFISGPEAVMCYGPKCVAFEAEDMEKDRERKVETGNNRGKCLLINGSGSILYKL